jgi:hypothetical protein
MPRVSALYFPVSRMALEGTEAELKRAVMLALERAVAFRVVGRFAVRAWTAIGREGRSFVAERACALGVPAARIAKAVSSAELVRVRSLARMWLARLDPAGECATRGPMLACLVERLHANGTRLQVDDPASAAAALECTSLGLFDALFAPADDARGPVPTDGHAPNYAQHDARCGRAGAARDAEP